MAEGHKEEYYEVEDQRFLGEQGFGDKVQGRVDRAHKAAPKRSMERIVQQLAKELKVSREAARSRDRSWEVSKARTMIAYVLTRRLGYRLGEVASYFHRDVATVGTLASRLYERMRSDPDLHKRVDQLVTIVEL